MSTSSSLELYVSVDVGCHRHRVAMGLSNGQFLEAFEIAHQPAGFREFFSRVETQEARYGCPVSVAMEAYNGYARPLDSLVLVHEYRLYNINNLKFARFKEIFPGAAKTDALDARKGLELFQLRDHLPLAKQVLQEVGVTPEANRVLKRLTRRRRRLVNEKTRVLNNLQADLQAICPNLLAITNEAENLWFLRLLTSTDRLPKLARVQRKTLLKIPGIGVKYADTIQSWQKEAQWSSEVEWVGEMIQEDAARVLELHGKIKALEAKLAKVSERSTMARLLDSIPGFGLICASELAGEIGTLERFHNEASLSLYFGMAHLDNSSGKKTGSKPPTHVNTRAKAAMMIAVDRHRKHVPASQRYYAKKRAEGKGHNQAIRALGRHLCRIIYKMLKEERPYQIRE
jgi:transposase